MKRALAAPMLALSVLAAALWVAPESSRANGVPQLVKLTYLEGVSNFGPKDAEGVLEFSFAEAYVRLEVKNLVPQPGYTYEGWLTGGEGEPYLVGPLPIEASGLGSFEAKLDDLTRYDYDLFVIAARAEGGSGVAIPAQLSIAGRFTVIGDGSTGAAGAGETRPTQLPDTGEDEPGMPWSRIFTTAAVMLGAALVVFGLVRSARHRRALRSQS